MIYDYIIWDWNGTLLNDVGSSLASVNDMLALRNKEPIDINTYRDAIGVPIIKFYEKFFDLENEDYNTIIKQYNDGYMKHLSSFNLSDGAETVLEHFKSNGCTQIIVSSSNNKQLTENVKKYGIYQYFESILGAEDFMANSKIERAETFLKNHGKGSSLVIGDLEHDAELAAAIGADCALLTTGHDSISRLKKSGARIIDSLLELID